MNDFGTVLFRAANGAARGGAGARGRGARRGRGGATRQSRPKKTAEDLDAEMEGK